MGILVFEAAAADEIAGLRKRLDDGVVGVALLALVVDDALALKARRVLGVEAVGADGIGDFGLDAASGEIALVVHPDVKVVAAVAGRGMDKSLCRYRR